MPQVKTKLRRLYFPDMIGPGIEPVKSKVESYFENSNSPLNRAVFILQVFFPDDLTHRFFLHFTFYPTDDIEVSKGPGFKTVLLKFFDLL